MKIGANGLVFFLLIGLPLAASAQFSNSWINFSQQYFKIPVARDGIYRLTYSNLQAAGFPVDGDPRYIRLFHRGKEQSIYIKGQSDGHFNTTEFIEFFGQKNDGTMDSLLYQTPSLQPHKYYNLYSDTTSYFLTYNFLRDALGMRMDSVQLANTGNLPAETYQVSERLFVFHDQYSQGLRVNDLTSATAFDQGEGWTGIALQQSQTIDYVIDSLTNGVVSGGNPKLELLLVGRDYPDHQLQVLVGPDLSNLRVIASPTISGFNTYLLSGDLNWSDIGTDGKMAVRIAALSTTTNRYQASASYAKVIFPQSFDLGNQTKKSFRLNVKPGQSYLSIVNPPSNLRLWNTDDPQSIIRILSTTVNPNPFNVIVQGDASKIYCSSTFITPRIIPVSFRDFSNSAANFLIITNKILRKPAGGYADAVQAYAAYRASSEGGGYDTLIANVDQLYDQFNYGEVSPLSIYSFMKFMTQKNIKYLFLVGKGRDITYSGYQRKTVPPAELRDLVPSAGYPAGDIAFTSGLGGTTFYPLVPTGRLTATTPAQVATYLNKVKQHESQPLLPWAKELLHLSGGGNSATEAFEIAYFKSIVDGFKQTAEGPYLGGHVTTKSKQDLGIERINISPSVNQGVNLVTYFGHASTTATEIDIGFVDDPTMGYDNKGKYPVFLFNGCNVGAVFGNSTLFTENWILTPDKGSRNFIAGSSFGYADELQKYSGLFYAIGFGDSTFIKTGIGDIQKETGRQYLATTPIDIYATAQVQQMILVGDPAIKLFGTNLPDYVVDNGSISLTSLNAKPVTSLSDSFALKIIVKNLGAYKPKPMKVRVIRTFNNNSTKTYDSTFTPVLYIDTLVFKLRKEKDIDGFGNNLFTVVIDPLNIVKEISETNNTGTLSAFIPSNGTINLYPANFGIVNSGTVNLMFQDANLLGLQRNFLLQIDTVATFNSPFVLNKTVSAKVLAKVSLNLLPDDSCVYYWRTKPVKQNASDSANWSTSSFVFIKNGPEGWGQKKFQQVSEDQLTNLTADSRNSQIKYQQTTSQVSIKSIGANSVSSFTATSLKIDGVEYNATDLVPCRNNTINLVAFNKSTSVPYPGINYFFDPRGCGLQPAVINSFLSNEVETGSNDLLVSITNIHANDSVVLYSIGNPLFSQWSPNVLTKLNDLGISNLQITSLQDGEPVIIFAKKGTTPGSAKIYRSSSTPATAQDLTVAATMTGRFSSGAIKSSIIGPAKKWVSFSAKAIDIEPSDQISYSIYGLSLDGQETLIQSNVTSSLDLSFIDPTAYPQLKVGLAMQDQVNQTAVQLKNWFVIYESVAEGLLIYQGPLTPQTVQEGQSFTAQYGFVNISSKDFADSLQVNAQALTIANRNSQSNSYKIKAPAPGDTTKFSFTISTKGKAGLNDLSVFVNPKILPEQFYENNVIGLSDYLNVIADHSRPVLDVTVDGRYLQNNDFISSNPDIQIKLHDDNPFLIIKDTTHLSIFLSYPCDNSPCPFKRINFKRNDLQWAPASSSSDFLVNFKPVNIPEGTYVLQVNGSDDSNNMAGIQPFEITFQVKDETTLKLNSVYPNPSNETFNFNFILSGNELPTDFSLQIFSGTGKLEQEFNLNDVSNFIIGTNNLSWNAPRNSFSNGLYIYRLQLRVNGKSFSESGKLFLLK